MAEFTMPSLGADMDEGLLVEWLVHPGDQVSKGDVVAVVETDKAAIEVECFESGTVGDLLVEPGTRVPVGTPLAVIEAAGAAGVAVTHGGVASGTATAPVTAEPVVAERIAAAPVAAEPVVAEPGTGTWPQPRTQPAHEPEAAPEPRRKPRNRPEPAHEPEAAPEPRRKPRNRPEPAHEPQAAPEPQPEFEPRPEHEGAPVPEPARMEAPELVATPARAPRAKRSAAEKPVAGAGPLVRHLAAERGIDLTSVNGTGRGGRITRADIEHAVAAPGRPRVRVTPYARRLARELGVDTAALRGSGDGGAVRAADVRAAARARSAPEPPPVEQASPPVERAPLPDGIEAPQEPQDRTRTPLSREPRKDTRAAAMRRAIAELMSRSKKEIPHYYLSTTIDLTAAMESLHRRNRGLPLAERLVPAALLLKAAATAARDVPQLNGFWEKGAFTPGTGVHLGVAVSLRDGGLLMPVIHDADTLAPVELMAALKDLVRRARLGRLRGSELAGATLTVTNLGDQGVESVLGVIHPPQVALVGFGAVVERPWAVGGLLGVRPVVTATLSADHRATDGAVGARYLTAIDRLLQKPEEL
ncbi:2-oxo acid dehydrogenase subunit E2 [Streptomyces sp. TRM68416]|uniref:2-oxo acid dehydrogenase subunit E2 n=1 Tax=Streptomyces sp. TRM68416 TaxID=2758412 RepID=UPI001661FCC7|nr:2-oxo acid dehydrogenase subunit E2 [Streptomyces sp. TRM68416]MBD0842066.1 2-oxo acid dehydrogenase subunit E2 [Streptomyces sp. TRM68416]